jgi:DNA helicase-2/ATP-dependent DNA helicase PcrA
VDGAESPSLADYLEEVALAANVDELDGQEGQVTLMTLHSAKGLEFNVVFLPGMEEGLFPHSRSIDDRAAIEEERRLCYVGLTRAQEQLHLSAARMRVVFGEPRTALLSRFLIEIPENLLDLGRDDSAPLLTDHHTTIPTPSDLEPSVASSERFAPGTRVFHATFGEGQVLGSKGLGKRQFLTIEFPVEGRKVIAARFVEPLPPP